MNQSDVTTQPKKLSRWWAIAIGLGLALLPIHNQWLTQFLTNSKGEVVFFLPAFGYLLVIMGTGFYILNHWNGVKKAGLGDLWLTVPLLVIVAFMGLSGIRVPGGITDKLAPFLMGVSLFALYLVSRQLGAGLFRMLVPFVVIGSVIAIVMGGIFPGKPASMTNGMITNYAAAYAFLLLGTVLNQGKWQTILVLLALVGTLFIGATESLVVVAVIGIIILVRRDFSRKIVAVACVIGGLVIVGLSTGIIVPLFSGNGNLATASSIISGNTSITSEILNRLLSGRQVPIAEAVHNISLLGHGYFTMSTVNGQIVHNIPLIIIDQLGIFAGIAWLVLVFAGIIRTKWKYAWIMVLAMGVFDHYLWTQFQPWVWVLAGVSSTSVIKNDLMFKGVRWTTT